ncbi:hypothetical protein RFI_21227, partial [Reticulomyxa filosa]
MSMSQIKHWPMGALSVCFCKTDLRNQKKKKAPASIANKKGLDTHINITDWSSSKMYLVGGMQNASSSKGEYDKYAKEMKALTRLCGDIITEEELRQALEDNNGNISMVIEQISRLLVHGVFIYLLLLSGYIYAYTYICIAKVGASGKSDSRVGVIFFCFLSFVFVSLSLSLSVSGQRVSYVTQQSDNDKAEYIARTMSEGSREMEGKNDRLHKEQEREEVGETKPGINLQGYCTNGNCLAAKGKLLVWVNIGFEAVSFTSDKALYCCPDCRESTVGSIVKAIQHATSLEDLRERSENAMNSVEITNLVTKLQKYEITV